MADIIAEEGGKKKGKKRAKKYSTHIDMTPMVDLACLLLTFFMLTTAFSKPKVMEIVLPEKQKKDTKAPEVPEKRVVNIILTENDRVLWYNGLAKPQKPPLPTINETDYSKDGIRRILLQRNKPLYLRIDSLNKGVIGGTINIPRDSVNTAIRKMKKDDELGPIVLIKADENVKYKNFVDIIDEMAITNIARYSVVELNTVEKKMIADFKAGKSGTATK